MSGEPFGAELAGRVADVLEAGMQVKAIGDKKRRHRALDMVHGRYVHDEAEDGSLLLERSNPPAYDQALACFDDRQAFVAWLAAQTDETMAIGLEGADRVRALTGERIAARLDGLARPFGPERAEDLALLLDNRYAFIPPPRGSGMGVVRWGRHYVVDAPVGGTSARTLRCLAEFPPRWEDAAVCFDDRAQFVAWLATKSRQELRLPVSLSFAAREVLTVRRRLGLLPPDPARAAKPAALKPLKKKFRMHAAYHQIRIQDANTVEGVANAWAPSAVEDRIAVAHDAVAFGVDADDVSIEVVIALEPPKLDLEAWQHMTEASLTVDAGELAVGMLEDKTFAVPAGEYRVRASHARIGTRSESLRLQVWPAALAPPAVLRRWVPPAPKVKRPTPMMRGRAALHAGQPQEALREFESLAAEGDVWAGGFVVQILAFQRRLREVVDAAMKTLPAAPHQSTGMSAALLRWAAQALQAPELIERALAVLPASAAVTRQYLTGDRRPVAVREGGEPQPRHFEAYVEMDEAAEHGKGNPAQAAHRRFERAAAAHMDDELLAAWEAAMPLASSEEAALVAHVLVQRGQHENAWQLLRSFPADRWYSHPELVLPAYLLLDPVMVPLMTPARCEELLRRSAT